MWKIVLFIRLMHTRLFVGEREWPSSYDCIISDTGEIIDTQLVLWISLIWLLLHKRETNKVNSRRGRKGGVYWNTKNCYTCNWLPKQNHYLTSINKQKVIHVCGYKNKWMTTKTKFTTSRKRGWVKLAQSIIDKTY
jgi:hypothetical protein